MACGLKAVKSLNDLKLDFPALAQSVNGRMVAYLDSAASAQKPKCVIDAMTSVMTDHYANVHRGIYTFSSKTSVAFEDSRRKVARFLNAKSDEEIVFTRNSTEAINLVASGIGQS
ncbi:MAG: aminotransferase class V-fold PLP-dependent enzyme, partial [Alphaproteobacteria bacterium]|nr:aminotransferase class V-fold PLP-dependent enzyme [Alphaproteobacteria bacterium]